MHNEKHDGFPLTSIREISSLRQSDHPNCVKLLGIAVGHKRDGEILYSVRMHALKYMFAVV